MSRKLYKSIILNFVFNILMYHVSFESPDIVITHKLLELYYYNILLVTRVIMRTYIILYRYIIIYTYYNYYETYRSRRLLLVVGMPYVYNMQYGFLKFFSRVLVVCVCIYMMYIDENFSRNKKLKRSFEKCD